MAGQPFFGPTDLVRRRRALSNALASFAISFPETTAMTVDSRARTTQRIA